MTAQTVDRTEPVLTLVPALDVEQPSLLVRILDAEETLDQAVSALAAARLRVEAAETALADLINVSDDA